MRERNEALDTRVYARAAAWIMGADRWDEATWRRLEAQAGVETRPLGVPAAVGVEASEPTTPTFTVATDVPPGSSTPVPFDRKRLVSKCLGAHSDKHFLFSSLESYSPNLRSHDVRRISAWRDRFMPSWHRGRCSACPANPFEKTRKSGRSRIGRTLSRGQVAEETRLRSNL